MQLIDRHALLKNIYDNPPEKARMTHAEWYRKCIYEAPTIEAEPVRLGRWIDNGEDKFICSACNGYVYRQFGRSDFCPRCGEKMSTSDAKE